MNKSVYSLTVYDDKLIAGRSFFTAGNKVSAYLTQWTKAYGFICGDANYDNMVSISDILYLKDYYYYFNSAPEFCGSGDLNCYGLCNLVDIVILNDFLFYGGMTKS